MNFETGAENAALFFLIHVKLKQLGHYTKLAEKLNSKRRSQSIEPKNQSNVSLRKKKSKAKMSVKRERNRLYQETYRKIKRSDVGYVI